jgi:hypothetical protein
MTRMAGFRRAIVLGLASLGLLTAQPLAARAGDGWWGDLDKGQSVRLSDVIASPEAFRGRVLTFTCVFHRREREFNPLRTRFNAERYDNVSVWPDGKALWLAADFEQDFPFLYVPRAHPQHDDLLHQETFTRLEVTGRIEAVLDGSPFIELTAFHATGHRLGKDVVEKMLRAETYALAGDAGAQSIAVDNVQAALDDTPDLAPLYAARIRARLADLLRALGRTNEADAVLKGERAASAVPAPAGAPGEAPPPVVHLPGTPAEEPGRAVDPPSAGEPFRPSLPGVPTDTSAPPVPPAARGEAPRGEALPGAPPARAPLLPAGTTPPPPPPPAPTGPFRPSLPGVPADTPAPPVKPEPRAETGPGVAPVPAVVPATAPAAVAAPEIVDPPLPAPAKNGAPPVRKPRLAGVK